MKILEVKLRLENTLEFCNNMAPQNTILAGQRTRFKMAKSKIWTAFHGVKNPDREILVLFNFGFKPYDETLS